MHLLATENTSRTYSTKLDGVESGSVTSSEKVLLYCEVHEEAVQ